MNDLTIYDPQSFDTLQRICKAMSESGYFQDARNIAQMIVKVQAGRELGLPPFASVTGLHIIQGKPVLGANVIATLIKNDPRYNYRVLELTDHNCKIEFYENGEACGVSSFSADDAQKAGVKNMNKFPRNMLFARAISNGAKWYTPGIFGGSPVYTPDEMGMDTDEDGTVIQGEIVNEPYVDTVALKQEAKNSHPETGTWEHVEEGGATAVKAKHDMTPPSPDTVAMWRGKVEKAHKLKSLTVAGMVANAVPYFDNDYHALQYTDYDGKETFTDNGPALEMFDKLVEIGTAKVSD